MLSAVMCTICALNENTLKSSLRYMMLIKTQVIHIQKSYVHFTSHAPGN